MDGKEKDLLYYEKLRTILLGGVLAVLVALLIGMVVFFNGLRQYEAQVSVIIDRLDRVSAQLEDLDTEKLVRTANELADALDSADIDAVVASLDKTSRELSEVDWSELASNFNDIANTTKDALSGLEEALDKISSLDIEPLNKAIRDLQDAIEPLRKFADLFG
jgi:ABC-type transporter Mla subunit MlaD